MISYIHTKQLNRSVTLIKWITAWFHCMHAMLLLRLKEAVCQNDDGGIYLTVVMSPVPEGEFIQNWTHAVVAANDFRILSHLCVTGTSK